MGRKKGSKNKIIMDEEMNRLAPLEEATVNAEMANMDAGEKKITPVSVDFTSEQLNHLAMKVNEIIEKVNG